MTAGRTTNPRNGARAMLALFVAGAAAWVPAEPARAQGGITVTVAPAEVTLIPGATARGVLVLSNPGDGPVEVVVDAVESEGSVSVEVTNDPVTVRSKGSKPVDFTVTRTAEGSGQTVSVGFVARTTEGGGDGAARAAVGNLSVKIAATPKLINATLKASFQTINENRPRVGALVVENLRETEVDLDALGVTAPDDVDITVECPDATVLKAPKDKTTRFDGCGITIGPRSQVVMTVRFEADDAVAPGPRDALFEIRAAATDPAVTADVVATFSFTVDVFAESEILKALGLPIFLLLPGMIVSVVAWFLVVRASLWRRAAARANLKDVPPLLTTGVLGIAVSLAIAAVYPNLTDLWPGERRDYLIAYGFRDFYYVFIYSFLVAGGVWIVSMLLFLLNLLRRRLFIPMPGDSARAVLRKLAFRRMSFRGTAFPVVEAGGKAALEIARRAAEKVLVSPEVFVELLANAPKDQKESLETAATATGRAALLRLWWRIHRSDVKEVGFAAGGVGKVQLVDTVQDAGQENPLVREVRS